MKFLKFIWLTLFAASFCAIGVGIGAELYPPVLIHTETKTVEYRDYWNIIEKQVEVPVYIEREVPQIITIETTVEVQTYPSLRYFKTYNELLTFFYATHIEFDDCDDMVEKARIAAENAGYYLGEVPISGTEYNKIFIEHPIPPDIYHMINFTWVGNDGYYIDFAQRDIKKATEFVRD